MTLSGSMAQKQSSHEIEVITKRRETIVQIRGQYKEKKQKLTTALLIAELDERGYKKVNERTLYRDMLEISKGNSYVRNIAEATYSEDIEKLAESLNIAEDQYWAWLKDPPTITKQKLEPGANKDEFIVVESTIETVSPITILDRIVAVVEAKKTLLSGDVLNLSIAMLGQRYREMQQQVQDAKNMTMTIKKGKPVKLTSKLKELPDASSN